jgi:hypothetical protein
MKRKILLLLLIVILLNACVPSSEDSVTTEYGLLAVDKVQVQVYAVWVQPHISVTVSGTLPDDCTYWEKREGAVQQRQEEYNFFMEIYVTQLTSAECDATPHLQELHIGLQYTSLPAGNYILNVNGVAAPFEITSDQAYDQNTAEQVEAVVSAVRADLAKNFNVTEFDIVSVQPRMWMNSCLNIADPDEICAEVLTPGYLVVAGDGEYTWEYHTNQDGSELRVLTPKPDLPDPHLR